MDKSKSPNTLLHNIPWRCALLITVAMALGLLADGIADGVAAVLLLVPSVIVFRRLFQRA